MQNKISGLMGTLAFISGLFLIGCNSSDSSTNVPGNGNTHATFIDACSFLTQADVEGVFGKPLLTTKMDTNKYITQCHYSGSADTLTSLPTRLQVLAFTNAGIQSMLSPTQSAQSYVTNLRTIFPATD